MISRLQLVCLLGCLLFVSGLQAAEDASQPALDWNDYSRQLDQAEVLLGKSLNDQEVLNKLTKEALPVIQYADACIQEQEAKLSKVTESIKSLGVASSHDELDGPRKKLDSDKADIEKTLAQCRLLKLKASDVNEQAYQAGQKLLQQYLFAKHSSGFDYFNKIIDEPQSLLQESVQIGLSLSKLPINLKNTYQALGYGLLGMLVGLFWSVYKRRTSRHKIPTLLKTSPALATVWNSTIRLSPFLLFFGMIHVYFLVSPPDVAVVSELSGILLVFTISYVIFRAMLRPRTRLYGFNPLLPSTSKKLFFWSRLLLLTFLLTLILKAVRSQDFSQVNLSGLLVVILDTLASFAMIRVLWLLRKPLNVVRDWYLHFIGIAVLLVAIIALWLGYINFATLLFQGVFGTAFILLIGWLLVRIPIDIFDSLDEASGPWQQKLRDKMGLGDDRIVPGLIWLRLAHLLVVGGVIVISLLSLWGMSEQSINLMLSNITNGYEIGDFTLEPLRILSGLLILPGVMLLTQFVKRSLSTSWLRRTNLSRGARDATVTITGYTGVALAILIGLTVAGINFGNLAIIAGALSLGIGFGLQNIVNNFISGLILLFERPIRRGDWIKVGVSEGYVKDISIRSTVIQTFDRADIIVPNSELISTQVTNMMLHNQFGRIIIPLRIAYGSDTEQVMQILTGVAESNPAVLRNNEEMPIQALFRSFGDSAMNFELRCHIQDVEWVIIITSELNLAIDKAFREAGIKIPPPHQVIRLEGNGYHEE